MLFYKGYISTFNDVRQSLPPAFFNKIKTLGFDQFLQSVDLNVNSYNLDDMIGRYIGNYQFHLKDKILRVTLKDIGFIFSLPYSGAVIQVSRKYDIEYATPLWRKYFNVKQVTSVMVKDVFTSVALSTNYDEENVNDICRLWFCLFCSCFLTPTSKTMIPLKLFYYLDRFEDIPRLNWSQYIFDQIFDNMESACYSDRHREKTGVKVNEYIVRKRILL
ncbi:hypothetical protein ZOSMA_242G00020 [Zostera marina]|uniref:Aminotransferase-like plant mobile domain-containing protein n=1 Tax=Zostera marina TaxID=29655 RepID=A0A0K9PGU3_ZOSMR|nr:hypothetical protein ZOSMA_242G00020 [Zostera marina]